MTGVSIRAREVSKHYRTGERSLRGRARDVVHLLGFGRGSSTRRLVRALDGVSFEIPEGEVIGLIGENGAGKSTLLRLVAGVSDVTTGSIDVAAPVTAILEITTGLVPESTGLENIAYMGRLYGMSAAEIEAKKSSIVDFADIGAFIDFPVRSYSAGMRARLAFSIVTSIDPEILLIDEALSVGDAGFALRCRHRMRDLCAQGATVVLVSHNLQVVRELCDRAIWLHEGRIAGDGDPAEVVEAYRVVAHEHAQRELASRFSVPLASGGSLLEVEQLQCVAEPHGESRHLFRLDEPFAVEGVLRAGAALDNVEAQLDLIRFDGVLVARTVERALKLPRGRFVLRLDFDPMRLGRFTYQVRLRLMRADEELCQAQAVFAVEDHHHAYNASYYQDVVWRVLDGVPARGSAAP